MEDEAAPAGDPTLPGLAGYPRRRGNDKMPTKRFTFVRPDGKPVQTGKDPRPDYW